MMVSYIRLSLDSRWHTTRIDQVDDNVGSW
jgi:hypothetical protein